MEKAARRKMLHAAKLAKEAEAKRKGKGELIVAGHEARDEV